MTPAGRAAIAAGFIARNPKPLDINFLAGETLDSRVSFARAGVANRINSAGIIEQVAADAPRFDYDPLTLAPRGLLIEEARTNIIIRSKSYLSFTANSNTTPSAQDVSGVAAPDGADGAAIIPAGATGFCQRNTGIPADFQTYAWSVFVKKLDPAADIITFASNGFSGLSRTTQFSFNTEAFTGHASCAVQKYPNGWYRLSQTFANNGTRTIMLLRLNAAEIAGLAYISQFQVEPGTFPSSPIVTAASAITRPADIVQIPELVAARFKTRQPQTWSTEFAMLPRQNFGTGPNSALIRAHDGYSSVGTRQMSASGGVMKAAAAFGDTMMGISVNGQAVESALHSGPMRPASGILLGDLSDPVALNGWLRGLAYRHGALTDAQLMALTA